jgi:ribosome maturation factor RimP
VTGTDELETALAPVCASLGVELFDLELAANTLQITVEGPESVDLELIAEVTRRVSGFLDEHEALAPSGRYELEVSSPGLERRLRRPEHFRRAIDQRVSVRTLVGTEGARRIEGILENVGEDGFDLVADDGRRHLRFAEVERAKTVFDWQQALRADAKHRDAADDARVKKTTISREARR